MVTDAFGEELRVGDYVGYISGGKWPTILKGEVVEIRKQLKVRVTQKVEGTVFDDYFWVNGRRCVKTLDSWTVEVEENPSVADVNVVVNVTGAETRDLLDEINKIARQERARRFGVV